MTLDPAALRAAYADREWQPTREDVRALLDALVAADVERKRLQQWVNDLHRGMFINCVYCGHRYGPNDEVPATMADVLKEHVEQCPKHPMSALRAERDTLRAHNEQLLATNETLRQDHADAADTIVKLDREGVALRAEVARLRAALQAIERALTIPAAEYVPDIGDAFKVIDAALAPPEGC